MQPSIPGARQCASSSTRLLISNDVVRVLGQYATPAIARTDVRPAHHGPTYV